MSRPLPSPALEDASAFVRSTGLEITAATPTRVAGWIELGPDHHTPWGIVHGGVYTSAIETAASIGASAAAAERDQIAVGVNNNTNFVRSMEAGRVEVVAQPLQQGRTQQLWDVRITHDDRLVASGQVRLQNVDARP